MFQTPKWDYDASSESLSLQLFGPHSTNGKKTKKRKKEAKTNKSIKETQLFPTKVKKKNIQTPTPTDAGSKAKNVKPKLMSLPASDNRMQNVERKKMKSKKGKTNSLSYMKRKSKSLNDKMMRNFEVPHFGSQKKIKHPLLSDTVSEECKNNETNICNSKVSESQLGLQKKRKLSSDIGLVPHQKKRKKTFIQDDTLLPESSISKDSDFESNKEFANVNRTKQNRKKHKKIVNKRVENLSESFEKHIDVHEKSTGKSPYNINRLKQMFAKSNTEGTPSKGNISEKKRKKETGTLRERMLKRLQASRFRYINEQLYTSGGKDAKQYFEAKPEVFQDYHEGYQQQVQQWPINPLDVIITALKKKSPGLVVADFGCGDARLAQSVPNKVHSFDLMAMSKEVTACDMAHTPLSIASVDVVVFCLSLMGTNLGAYLTEANRVLVEGGLLKIAEVESRFEDVQAFIKTLQKFGFVSIWKDLSHNLFYFMDFKKERCISKKMKKKLPELTLKPCLYKKR